MAYEFKYRLSEAPTPTAGGSGLVMHQLVPIYRTEGTQDPWTEMAAWARTVPIPDGALKTINDMPHTTGALKAAKNTAYKALLADHLNDVPATPAPDWSLAGLARFLAANDAATLEAQRADDYITVTLGQEYPVDFVV